MDNLVNYLKSMNKNSAATGGKSADKLVIGVAGVPNTGKSSVINSLKRKRICEAGNLAGLTRNLQHVALDGRVVLVDSPGIVLAASSDPAEYALRNCVRPEKIEDLLVVAEAIYTRCSPAQLQWIYKLPANFEDAASFLLALAGRSCPLKKGGIPDLRAAALRLVLDWNKGKIAYCMEPPVSTEEDMLKEIMSVADETAAKSVALKMVEGLPTVAVLKGSFTDMQVDAVQADDESEEEGDDVDMDE